MYICFLVQTLNFWTAVFQLCGILTVFTEILKHGKVLVIILYWWQMQLSSSWFVYFMFSVFMIHDFFL